VLLVSGANPTDHLPLGSLFRSRGDLLADAVRRRLPREGVTFVDNWADAELMRLPYWSIDRLHLNARGHARVAANVLAALDVPPPTTDADDAELSRPGTVEYWRRFVLPWVGRRLTGRSSGDSRDPKRPTLEPVEVPPPAGDPGIPARGD